MNRINCHPNQGKSCMKLQLFDHSTKEPRLNDADQRAGLCQMLTNDWLDAARGTNG